MAACGTRPAPVQPQKRTARADHLRLVRWDAGGRSWHSQGIALGSYSILARRQDDSGIFLTLQIKGYSHANRIHAAEFTCARGH